MLGAHLRIFKNLNKIIFVTGKNVDSNLSSRFLICQGKSISCLNREAEIGFVKKGCSINFYSCPNPSALAPYINCLTSVTKLI